MCLVVVVFILYSCFTSWRFLLGRHCCLCAALYLLLFITWKYGKYLITKEGRKSRLPTEVSTCLIDKLTSFLILSSSTMLSTDIFLVFQIRSTISEILQAPQYDVNIHPYLSGLPPVNVVHSSTLTFLIWPSNQHPQNNKTRPDLLF
ncbi:hypothetical protein P168DRAFT_66779 [Aspergillus campestris IBT 28561]|uniref:Uncharacterized protein n=1 Tax=Aspergillus campestris (strain IBT 28561) TaxID=1392248 RepID=A0A2I1CTG2_ASPC2|nr:uncharacterized protein P168DRAFT_66779 [Aspergillus campestris IBT 28561]PKY00920.1 hypothetical protein P168DRAFT_66779 [Aspergillus campestris IBT 28561]